MRVSKCFKNVLRICVLYGLTFFRGELLQAKADEDAREKAEEQWRDDVNGKWQELEDWRKKEEVCVRV